MMSIDDDTFFLLLIRPLGETGYSRVLMSAESLDFDENSFFYLSAPISHKVTHNARLIDGFVDGGTTNYEQ